MGTEFQFSKMTRVLEMDSGDGSTTCELYLTPVNCVLKTGKPCCVYFTSICFFFFNGNIQVSHGEQFWPQVWCHEASFLISQFLWRLPHPRALGVEVSGIPRTSSPSAVKV